MNFGLPSAAGRALKLTVLAHFFPREWDFDLKKLPNIKMRKLCANDAIPRKRKQKAILNGETDLNIEKDLGELELTVGTGDTKDGELEPASEASDSDEEMTPVPACP